MNPNSRLKPTKDFKYYKRDLPHYEDPGSFYFITFTTIGDLELSDNAKDIVFNAIKFHADKKYKLYAYVVMKTHVHVILSPISALKDSLFSLAQITHSIKSYSANKVNEAMDRTGKVWLDENYDRIIRDDYDFFEKMNYIIHNPLKAGLVKQPEVYKWLFYKGYD